MKKLLLSLLVLLLIPSLVFADIDFSSLSLSDLYILRESVCAEILSRSQWESVTVPAGFYIVGEDIPAGHWTIRFSPGEYCLVEYFLKTDETGKRPANAFNDYYYEGVCDPDNYMSSVYLLTQFDLELKEGYHVVLNYGSAIFEPFTGRPSPFF